MVVLLLRFMGTLQEMKYVHGIGQVLHLRFVVMGIVVVQVFKEVISATLSRYSDCTIHPSLGRIIWKPLLLIVSEPKYVKRRLFIRKSMLVYIYLVKIFHFH